MSFIQSWEDNAEDINTTSCSVAVAGATVGNKLIAVLSVRVGAGDFSAAPAGWSFIIGAQGEGSSADTMIYERTATGDSGDDFAQSWTAAQRCFALVSEYSGLLDATVVQADEDVSAMLDFNSTTVGTGSVTSSGGSTAIAVLGSYDYNLSLGVTAANSTIDYTRTAGGNSRPGVTIGNFPAPAGAHSDTFTWSTGTRAYGAILLYEDAGSVVVPVEFDGPDVADITGTQGAEITPVDVSGLFSGTETPFTFQVTPSATAFPSGITCSAEGVISGTPIGSGTTTATGVRAVDDASNLAFTNLFDFIISTAAPTIDTQPESKAVTEPAAAVFTVSATSSGGTLSYQWKEDGVNVGADSPTYNTGTTSVAQNGSVITVDVTDDNGTTTSDGAATLTVNAASEGVSVASYQASNYTTGFRTDFTVALTPPTAGDVIVAVISYSSNFLDLDIGVTDNNAAPLTRLQGYVPVGSYEAGGEVWYKVSDGTETDINASFGELCNGGIAVAVYSGLNASPINASSDDETYAATVTNTFNSGSATATSVAGVAVYCAMPELGRRWFGSEVSITHGTLHGTAISATTAPQPFMAYEIFDAIGSYGTQFNTTDTIVDSTAYGAVVVLGATLVSAPISWDGGTVNAPGGSVGAPYSLDIGAGFSGSATPFAYEQTAGTDIASVGLALDVNGVIAGSPTSSGTLSGIVITGTDQGSATAAPAPFDIVIDEVSAVLPADTGTFISEGFNANIYTGLGIQPLAAGTGGFVQSGFWAELIVDSNELTLPADAGAFALNGFNATFSLTAANANLPADAGVFNMEGFVANILTGLTSYTYPLNEGSGVVAACIEGSEWDAAVDATAWRTEPSNNKRWPINEGTGALLSEVQTGTSEYDATIQSFDESGWD